MRILLSGYYGFGNAGDEAILAGTVGAIRRRLPECELTVLSADPEATRAAHGVEAAQRWHWPTIWRELGQADHLLQGGGGLIQDSTSCRSVFYYLGILQAARLRRKPYMIYAQGLGPLTGGASRRLTRRLIEGAAAVTVRDPASAELLQALGVRREITVTADAAALLEPAPPEEMPGILPEPRTAPLIGLALREAPGADRLFEGAVAAARHLRETAGAEILVMALHARDDVPPAARVAEELGGRAIGGEPLPPREWMGLVARLDFVIAMRLHAAIFAAATAVPFISLSYDPKVAAFARGVGAPAVPRDASPEDVVRAADDAWQARRAGAEQRAQAAAKLRADAERNVDVLADLVDRLERR